MYHQIDYLKFKKEFLESELGKRVSNDFDILSCNDEKFPAVLLVAKRYKSTIREIVGTASLGEPLVDNRRLSIITFFYLQFLVEIKPKQIYDLGCGWNIWKRYIPEIVGVDHRSKFADVLQDYDEVFWNTHQGSLDAIMCVNMNNKIYDKSCNKIVPLTLENIGTIINSFAGLLKPGGRGYTSFPLPFVYYQTPDEWFEKNNVIKYDVEKIKSLLTNQITSLPLKIIAMDVETNIIKNNFDHDGEIRVVFEV